MNGIDIMDIMAAAGHVAIAIGAIAAAIGPEGDFSPREVEAASAGGLP